MRDESLVARLASATRRSHTASMKHTPHGGLMVPAARGVPLMTLLSPKWLTARARAVSGERGRGVRFAVLGVVGVVFWIFWDSPRSFVVMIVLGLLVGLWHGRKLHLIDPNALERHPKN